MDTGRKKEILAMLERRMDDPRSRTTTKKKKKKQPQKQEDVDESSLVVSHRMHTNMRSEVTMQTEEDEDI